MKKSCVIIILIAVLLLSAVFLYSCNSKNNSGKENKDDTSNTDAAGQNEQEQQEEKINVVSVVANLPDEDYGGYEFKIWTSNQIGPIDTRQAPEEEQNGDPVNDSLYIRDKLVEDKYNIRDLTRIR